MDRAHEKLWEAKTGAAKGLCVAVISKAHGGFSLKELKLI